MTALSRLTSPQCRPAPVLLVPCGSCEQHGPHLPLGTDTAVARAVSDRAATVLRRHGLPVVVAPALSYGASGEHQSFPGTLSIGHTALYAVLLELGRSASTWAAATLLVNGHGGNLPTVARAAAHLTREGHRAAWTACVPRGFAGADAHAGRVETSLMLALDPDSVRLEDATAGATAPLAELMPALRRGGVAAVSPTGVLGDPAGANAAEGHRLLDTMAADVAAAAQDLLDVWARS